VAGQTGDFLDLMFCAYASSRPTFRHKADHP